MLRAMFAAGLLGMLCTGAAIADDMSGTEWSGLYAGLQTGSNMSDISDGTASLDFPDSTDIGAHVGYMQDMGAYVVGGELEIGSITFGQTFGQADVDGMVFRLKGRVGYDAGKIMPYVTVGVTNLTLSGGGDNIHETGLSSGLGLDYMVTDRFMLGGELLSDSYSDFAKNELGISGVTYTFNSLELRAAMRF